MGGNRQNETVENSPLHDFDVEPRRILQTMLATIDPQRFVGRIGKLKDAAASCCYVIAESYDSESAEYEVKLLRVREGSSLRVKPSEIEFQTTPEFLSAFPNSSHYLSQGFLDMGRISPGSVVDFTQCHSEPVVEGGKLFIRGSYRFVGKIGQYDGGSVPGTRLSCCVYIGAQNENDIIEFENILFLGNGATHNVVCLRGSVAFRNCDFVGATNGFKVGSGSTSVNVLMERGNIMCNRGCGVTVDAHAQFTTIDVNIETSNLGVGAIIKGGGVYAAHHCTFVKSAFGLVMSGETGKVELTNSTLRGNRRCGVLVDGGTLSMDNCDVLDAKGCGVIVADPVGCVKAEAALENCRFSNCRCAIRTAGMGTWKSSNLSITDCTVGVYLTYNTTGLVALHSPLYNNNAIDVVNLALSSRLLSIDGINEPVGDMQKYIQDVHNTVLSLPEKVNELSRALSTEWSIKAKRIMARLDLHAPLLRNCHHTRVPHCQHCNKLETSNGGRLFKKCVRCKRVCYCTKNCQMRDWTKHKIECRMPNDWYIEIWHMVHGSCMRCNKIMDRTDGFDESVLVNSIAFCQDCVDNHYGDVQRCVKSLR